MLQSLQRPICWRHNLLFNVHRHQSIGDTNPLCCSQEPAYRRHQYPLSVLRTNFPCTTHPPLNYFCFYWRTKVSLHTLLSEPKLCQLFIAFSKSKFPHILFIPKNFFCSHYFLFIHRRYASIILINFSCLELPFKSLPHKHHGAPSDLI